MYFSSIQDFHHPTNQRVHDSEFFIEDGVPVLSLQKGFNDREELSAPGCIKVTCNLATARDGSTYLTAKYAIGEDEWHFIAFSYDKNTQAVLIIIDDKVHTCYRSSLVHKAPHLCSTNV